MMLFLSLNLITQECKSDCKQDCEKVIQAAKSALSAKDDEIAQQSNSISNLQRLLSSANQRAEERDSELSSWYHNPFVLVVGGVLVGGLGYSLLRH